MKILRRYRSHIGSFLFCLMASWQIGQPLQAGNGWTGGGTTTNWSDANNWGGVAPTYGTLTFNAGGAQGTTSIVDANISMNQLLWTGSSAWTLNNSGGSIISLFDNGGTQAKLENQSTGLVTINAPIAFAATAGAAWGEINAVNGDLLFGSAGVLTVDGSAVNGIKMFSAGRTTTFNNTVSATGKYFATTGATGMTMNVGGAFTSGDIYLMNGSTLKLNSGGSITTSGLRLGGDFGTTLTQDLAKGATLQLTSLTGGQSFGSNINTVTSNTSGALIIDSLATSGTNTLSGSLFLDSNLIIQQATGGTLAISGAIQNGSGFTKKGGGTLDLQAVNTFTGTMVVDGGTVRLGGNGTASATSGVTIGNRSTLTLDNSTTNLGDRTAGAITSTGGTINFIGNAAATTETLGALTLNAGALTINNTAAAGGNTLTIPLITRSVAGGTLFLNNSATSSVVLSTAPALVNSILKYAIVNNGSLTSFANYTTSAGTNQTVVPLALASHAQGAESTWNAATVNARPSVTVPSAVGAARTLYTLTLDSGVDITAPTTSDRVITISGGVLQTGGLSTVASTTTLETVFAFGANEALFHVLGTGTLQLNRGNTNTLTGSGGFTKSGAGTLILNGVSTLTGAFHINEGITELRGATALMTTAATINLNGGTLRLSNDTGTTYIGNMLVNADATIQVDRVTAAATATTHQLGTLSIGGGRTLSINSNDINSGTAYGFTAGALTLTSGGATFDVANNGAGTGTMIVTSVTGAFQLIKTGAGDFLNNSVAAGYTTPVEIQAGRLGWGGSTGTVSESQTFFGAGGLIKSGVVVVNLSGTNTFTGGVTVNAGTLGFSTVSDNGGTTSNLGQGTDGISLGGGTLSFIGGTSQSTNRAMTLTASSTLNASGTGGATIGYTGAITAAGNSLTLNGTGAGSLTGGLTQTGTSADITVSSGTWTISGGLVTVADDVTVVGPTAVLNLNTTGGMFFIGGGTTLTDSTLNVQNGAFVNLGANDVSPTDIANGGVDRLLIGQATVGAVGTLNTNTFNLTSGRLDLGQVITGLEGAITGTGTITITSDFNFYRGTVSANLAGAAAVEKSGLGTVTFAGDNSGLTSATAVRIDSGNLVLDYTTSNTDKLRALTGLDMRGGTLTLTGNTAATAQTVASLTLASGGANKIDVNAGAGGAVLNLNTITRTALGNDGTMRFELPTGTQSASNGITTDTLNTLGAGANAILGGWATVNDGTGVFFARNATNAADGNIVAAATTLQDDIGSWVAGDNVSDNTLGFSGALDGISLNSLRFNANAASAVAINSGGVLGVNSGGIMMNSAAATGTHSISDGRLVSGIQELIITQDSAVGLEVSSTITGNTGLTKAGNGILTLSGSNNYTGPTDIQAGTVIASGGNAIGNNSVVTLADDQASTLQITGNETIGALAGGNATTGLAVGTVDIGANTLTINVPTANVTYAGVISGSGSIVKTGNFDQILTGASGAGFTGTVTVNIGAFRLSGVGSLNATNITVNKGSLLYLDKTGATRTGTAVPDNMTITLNSADGAFSGQTIPRGLRIATDQAATTNETVGVIMLNSGANYASLDGAATSAITAIIADNITRSNNSTFAVRGTAMSATANARGQLRIGTAGNQTTFISAMVGGGGALGTKTISIVPWAIAQESASGSGISDLMTGNSLASYVSGQGFRALDTATEYNTYAASATATENIRESSTTSITGLAGKTINALVINNSNTTAASINVSGNGAGQTLAVTSGTLLFTLNSAAVAGAYGTTLSGFDSGITTAGTSPEYTIFVVNPDSAAATKALTATISSNLTSTADITKSGRGVLVLSGTNTAGGATKKTTINEGTLQIADLDNIGGGTGALVFAGGTLKLGAGYADDFSTRTVTYLNGGGTIDTNGIDLALAGSLGSGSGTFTKTGNGNLTLNAATAHTGATAITAGTVTLGANQAIGTGALTVSGATTVLALGSNTATVAGLTMTTAGASITGSGTLTVNGDAIMNNSSTIAPILGGSMNLLIPGGGVLTLSNAANTFTGYTWVQSGGVSVGNLANAGSASGLGAPVAGDNAAIRLGSTTTNGTLLITATTGTGGTTDRPFWLTGTTGGGTIDNDGTAALILNGNIRSMEYGAKTLTLQGATTGFDNVFNGIIDQPVGTVALTKAEAGTWVLGNTASPSTYTGINTITAGVLQVNRATGGLGDSTAVNAINLNGGTLSLRNNGVGNNGSITYGSASNPSGYNVQLTAASSTINVANLTANTGNTIFLGPLTQATALARTLNVTGANGYTLTFPSLGLNPGTGQTTTLNPTTSSLIITGNVTNPMSGFAPGNFDTISLDGTSTGNSIGGTISDAVGGSLAAGGYTIVTKSNTGTWTLNGTGSTYTGATNINGGVLIAGTDTALGNSTITFGGGTLDNQNEIRTFANNVLMNGTGTLTGTGDFNFNGNLSETGGNRQLNINNTGTTTFGDSAADTITLAENNQARTLSLNVASTASAIINATIQDGTGTGVDGLTKLGVGSLTINTANTYTGITTIDEGDMIFAVDQTLTGALRFGNTTSVITAGTLDLTSASATFGGLTVQTNSDTAINTVEIASGEALNINGNVTIGAAATSITRFTATGGGSLAVNNAVAAANFTVGGAGANKAVADLSGLSTVTINLNTTDGLIRISPQSTGNVSDKFSTLTLASLAGSVNALTAKTLSIGDGGTFNSAAGQINSLILGSGTGTTNSINVDTINIGHGTRDFGQIIFNGAGGTLTIRGALGGSTRAAFNMAAAGGATATFEPTVFNLFDVTGHSADLLFGAVNIGAQSRNITSNNVFSFDTGTLDMTSLTMSTRTGGTGTPVTNSTMNLGGTGTATIGTGSGTAITLSTASAGTTGNSTINLTGSSTTTITGNVVRGGGAGTTSAIINLQGSATLDMSGFSIGDGTNAIIFNVESGTLQNLGQFNNGASLVKTTSGTLTMSGTNTYTGNNVFQDGTVIADGGANNRLSQTALTLGNSTTSAILQLGDASGASDQTFTSLATSGTGTTNAIVGGNATFSTLTVNQSINTTFEGNIGGVGANQNNLNVVKSGVGELVVSGAGTGAWTGTTNVSGGKLFIDTTGAFAANSISLTVGDGAEFSLRGTALTANQVYGFGASAGNKITVGSGAGTSILGFRLDGAFNTQLKLLTGQTMTVATGSMLQTAVYVDSAPTAGQGYVLIDGADAGSLHVGGGTFDFNPVVFNGGSFSYALTNVTLGGTVDRWVITPTAQAAVADTWWKGDLTGIATGVWSASLTSGTGFPTNWDSSQSGGVDAIVPPDSGSIVHFSATGATNFATTLGANLTIQELIFHSGGTAISIDGNTGTYTLTLGNTVDASGLTLLTGAPNVSITADIALAQAQSFNIADTSSTLTLSRSLSGLGALGINDNGSSTGTMILSGVNGLATYTGATNLVAGRLILEGLANNRLPTTTALTLGNATLGATLQLGDAINGASNLTIGTLNTGVATTNAIVGGGATASVLTIVQGAAGTFNGVIGGGGTNENQVGLIKQGSATLILNGANTYLGTTTVNNGILQLGSTATLTQSSALIITASAGVTASFDNNSRPTVLTGGITLGGADTAATPQITNTGGAGSITLGGNVLYDATNNPSGGSIAAPLNLGTAARTFTVNDSASAAVDLTLSGAILAPASGNGIGLTFTGSGVTTVTGGITLTASGDNSGADIAMTGTGTLNLNSSANTIDDFNHTSGTVNVNNSLTVGDDYVTTGATAVANFNIANALPGTSSGSNGLYGRAGATLNINANGALGSLMDFIILGDDNNGTGNLVMNANASIPRLDVGFNSSTEIGSVTGTGTLTVSTSLNLRNGTVSANLDGAAATLKTDIFTVVLSGNNSLTGTTLVEEGTLTLDYATQAGISNKIGTGNLSIGSTTHSDLRPILNFAGHAITASRQDVANFSVLGGPTQINITGTAGVDNILRITGTLARTGGTVNFSLGNANTKLEYSGATTNTNGILPAWMILNRSDFAAIVENGAVDNIVAATYTTQNNASLWGTNQNVTNSASFSGTVDADCNTINSLRFNAAAASTITIASGNSLIVSSGGIMATSSVGAFASTITGGSLVSGVGEFFFHQNNTASTVTIASRILGSPAITKTGDGVLVLSGVNNQTGAIVIEEGRIRLSGGSAISDTSGVTIRNNGGTSTTGLELAASQSETIGTLTANTTAAAIILNTGSALTIVQGSAQTMAGVISGAGQLIKQGSSTLTLTGNNTNTGNVTVSAGLLSLSGGSGDIAQAGSYTLNGGELRSVQDQGAAIDRISNTTAITLNNTGGTNGLTVENNYTTTAAARDENVGPINLGAGHNVVTALPTNVSTATVALVTADTLARGSNRATLLVRGLALGSTATVQKGLIRFDAGGQAALNGFEVGGGTDSGTQFKIIPFMIGDTTNAGFGNSFVTNVDATTGLRPLATGEYINDSTAITGALNDNIRYTATAAITVTPTAINSLVLDSGTAIALTGSASAMEITSGAILAAGTGNHSIGTIANITTGSARDYTIYVTTAASTLTISSALSSAVPLVKSGAGTLSLTAAGTGNQFTDIYLNQGTVLADDLDRLGTGTLHFFGGGVRLAAGFADDLSTKPWNINTGGGTIDVSLVTANSGVVTFANGIDDTTPSTGDTLTVISRSSASAGQLVIQGASTFTGTIIFNHTLVTNGNTNSVVLNGSTNAAINGNIQLGSNTLPTANEDIILALGANEQIVDTASITFNSSSGEEAYFKLLGFTETVAGISAASRGVIENHESATDTVAGNGKLIVNSSQDFSFTGFLRDRASGTGGTLAFEKQGAGTQTLVGANIIYTGATTISGGTLQLTDATAFSAASAIINNANLTINRTTGTQTFANTISGSGTLTKLGDGTVALTGTNIYTGQTNIEEGALSISASANLGDATNINNTISIANNATLQSTGANVDLGVNRSITMAGAGATIEVTGTNTLTAPGALIGDACQTLTKSGSGLFVLSHASNGTSFSGGITNVNAGILQVGTGGSTGSGLVTVASGAILAGTGTVSGNLTVNSGGVLHAGDVTTVGNTTTTVTGIGALTVAGNVTLSAGSTTRFDISTPASSDFLGVGGNITSLGNIVVTGVSFVPAIGQTFNLIDWTGTSDFTGFNVGANTRTGGDDNGFQFDLPDITSSGFLWDVSNFISSGSVSVVPEPSRALLLFFGLLALFMRRRRNG